MIPHPPFDPSLLDAICARDAGDNLVIFVNNMGPADTMDPVSEEVYSPTDRGGK